MATTENLRLDHVIIDGDGFHSDAGEAHVELRVLVRWSGNDVEVDAISGRDLHSGRPYSRDDLERLASTNGRLQLEAILDAAIDRYERSGRDTTPCRCGECLERALQHAA